ncbi:MAG: DUF4215 domain-containing protein [Spirochaetia bacterium]|nr:DUF4215 domain-containing protein [Spirochaetia bacterium]
MLNKVKGKNRLNKYLFFVKFLILVNIFFVISCSDDKKKEDTTVVVNDITLSGSVSNGPALAGKTVTIKSADGQLIGEAVTDASGNYSIDIPENTVRPLIVTAAVDENTNLNSTILKGSLDFTSYLAGLIFKSTSALTDLTVNINPMTDHINKKVLGSDLGNVSTMSDDDFNTQANSIVKDTIGSNVVYSAFSNDTSFQAPANAEVTPSASGLVLDTLVRRAHNETAAFSTLLENRGTYDNCVVQSPVPFLNEDKFQVALASNYLEKGFSTAQASASISELTGGDAAVLAALDELTAIINDFITYATSQNLSVDELKIALNGLTQTVLAVIDDAICEAGGTVNSLDDINTNALGNLTTNTVAIVDSAIVNTLNNTTVAPESQNELMNLISEQTAAVLDNEDLTSAVIADTTEIEAVVNSTVNTTKTIYETTGSTTLSDADAVLIDKASLVIIYSGLDSSGSITQDLILPVSGFNGTAIEWAAYIVDVPTDIIGSDGTVTQPYNTGNITVTLIATISKGSAVPLTKTFIVTVVQQFCGDNIVNGSETCDDGNTADDGNGCSGTCLFSDGQVCTANAQCNSGVCDLAANGSSTCEAANVCGNGIIDAGEVCDDGNLADDSNGCAASCLYIIGETCTANTDCDSTVCDLAVNGSSTCEAVNTCGNGSVEAGEVCDDGNQADDLNGCAASCLYIIGETCTANADCDSSACDLGTNGSTTCEASNVCGNGIVDTGEGCDDGNQADDGNGCNETCFLNDGQACTGNAECNSTVCDLAVNGSSTCEMANWCGNGVIETGEVCDDGNTADDANGCSSGCLFTDGEVCASASDCLNVCDLAIYGSGLCEPLNTCGNGTVDAGEVCDDGNLADDANGCAASCLYIDGETCTGSAECDSTVCDLAVNGSSTCEAANTCGNGTVDAGEVCDDGNTADDANGCAATCLFIIGETCTASADCDSNACDLGVNGSNSCEAANVCGNGIVDATEGCDDGNTIDDLNGCSDLCLLANGETCTANYQCTNVCDTGANGSLTCEAIDICGNGVIETGEGCDDGNTIDDANGCSATCLLDDGQVCTDSAQCTNVCDTGINGSYTCEPANVCGNGVIEGAEVCDDGNVLTDDCVYGEISCTVCDNTCNETAGATSYCGDGLVDGTNGEACDGDGAGTGGETAVCDTDCTDQSCGDSTVNATAGEDCDSGGLDSADCVGSTCLFSVCGDSYINTTAGENCEDGNSITDNCTYGETSGCLVCTETCQTGQGNLSYCGDFNIDAANSEECDDGVNNNDSIANYCRTNCQSASCGDGVIDTGETCDDGNTTDDGNGCDAVCAVNNTCGNGILEPAVEQCDDNNLTDGDGCTSLCKHEFIAVSSGTDHTLAIAGNGTLWAWGSNSFGQLGDGTEVAKNRPVQIGTDMNWLKIEAGNYCSYAIKIDGTLWAWGYNSDGRLGDGSQQGKNSPTQVAGDTDWAFISAGADHTLALKTGGTLWAWGYNSDGQLGDDTNVQKNAPVQIDTETTWQSISAGFKYSAAIKNDGSLWVWGDGSFNKLGLGSDLTDKYAPYPMGSCSYPSIADQATCEANSYTWTIDTDWLMVSAGYRDTMALKTNNTLYAWGMNTYGEVGLGNTSGYSWPQLVGYCDGYGSPIHQSACESGGYTWVYDTDWVFIETGLYTSFAKKTDGSIWVWGLNNDYQLGMGDGYNAYYTPQLLGKCSIEGYYRKDECETATGTWIFDTNWVSVSTGIQSTSKFTTALKSDGTIWIWGQNDLGQLGDGTKFSEYIKKPTQTIASSWAFIGTNGSTRYHGAAINKNGSLYTWGKGTALGLGDNSDHDSPQLVGACTNASYFNQADCELNAGTWNYDTNWLNVSAGSYYNIAIKNDHTLWAWGSNSSGRLGLGNTLNYNIPQLVGSCTIGGFYTKSDCEDNAGTWNYDTNWNIASAGDYTVLAIKTDGTLWSWGSNTYGQLGDGTNGAKYSPVQIGSDTTWVDAKTHTFHSVGLKDNGTIYTWGHNTYGQLGLGDTTHRDTPQLVGVCTISGYYTQTDCETNAGTWNYDSDWENISIGKYFTMAVKIDGTIWGWGHNESKVLGSSVSTNSTNTAPLLVSADADWKDISASDNHVLAVKANGTLWAWGNNYYGQLGADSIGNGSFGTPVQIGSDANWVSVYAGQIHSFALKADGTLWAWGENIYNQLGMYKVLGKYAGKYPEQVIFK